jgi:hypothetical protein
MVKSGPASRALPLFLLAIPLLYLGAVLAVSVHELIGHGLVTRLLGGKFNGFGITLDTMGWAEIDAARLPGRLKALVLLGGAACTIVVSLVFIALGTIVAKGEIARFICLIMGFCFMIDGLPYFFWDAILLGGIGDFSFLYLMYPHGSLRIAVIALCGPLMAGIIFAFNSGYYRIALRVAGGWSRTSARLKAGLAVAILLQQALFWLAFDWNQVVPGAGIAPSLLGLAIAAAALTFSCFRRTGADGFRTLEREPRLGAPLAVAWTACAAAMLCIALFLQNGITLHR